MCLSSDSSVRCPIRSDEPLARLAAVAHPVLSGEPSLNYHKLSVEPLSNQPELIVDCGSPTSHFLCFCSHVLPPSLPNLQLDGIVIINAAGIIMMINGVRGCCVLVGLNVCVCCALCLRHAEHFSAAVCFRTQTKTKNKKQRLVVVADLHCSAVLVVFCMPCPAISGWLSADGLRQGRA